jgi:hypothetical protein
MDCEDRFPIREGLAALTPPGYSRSPSRNPLRTQLARTLFTQDVAQEKSLLAPF